MSNKQVVRASIDMLRLVSTEPDHWDEMERGAVAIVLDELEGLRAIVAAYDASLETAGGRCPHCDGAIRVDMASVRFVKGEA